MKGRFLLYRLSHTTLVLDISEIGLPDEIYPAGGKKQMIPSRRFQVWEDAERYLLDLGAKPDAVREASAQFKSAGFAVLTLAS